MGVEQSVASAQTWERGPPIGASRYTWFIFKLFPIAIVQGCVSGGTVTLRVSYAVELAALFLV